MTDEDTHAAPQPGPPDEGAIEEPTEKERVQWAAEAVARENEAAQYSEGD